jgi:hypothetical protein
MTEKRPRRPQSKGKCVYCGAVYTKSGMGKHLSTCSARAGVIDTANRENKTKSRKWLLLEIAGAFVSGYWIYLEIDAAATLKTLDQFLRDIWLECCGHLSKFDIEGRSYSVSPMAGYGERGMNIALEKVLKVGTEFQHEYDYGTPTELVLKVVGERTGVGGDKAFTILARNDAPVFECDRCHKQPATLVCTICMYGGDEIFVCETCKKQHTCYINEKDDYMFLPVVNSPRMGECGYTGSEIYPS